MPEDHGSSEQIRWPSSTTPLRHRRLPSSFLLDYIIQPLECFLAAPIMTALSPPGIIFLNRRLPGAPSTSTAPMELSLLCHSSHYLNSFRSECARVSSQSAPQRGRGKRTETGRRAGTDARGERQPSTSSSTGPASRPCTAFPIHWRLFPRCLRSESSAPPLQCHLPPFFPQSHPPSWAESFCTSQLPPTPCLFRSSPRSRRSDPGSKTESAVLDLPHSGGSLRRQFFFVFVSSSLERRCS